MTEERELDIRSLLTELALKLDAEGNSHGVPIYNDADDPSKIKPREGVFPSLLDAALFPDGTERVSCKFYQVHGFYVSRTKTDCINFGQSDVSMASRLSQKKRVSNTDGGW
jgi:hypothetical protein